jgi:hypothetical protein
MTNTIGKQDKTTFGNIKYLTYSAMSKCQIYTILIYNIYYNSSCSGEEGRERS